MRGDQFLQCTNAACALRFPGPPEIACPFCQGPTRIVAERYANVPRYQAPRHTFSVIFDNVRSAHNVGVMLRTAEALGVVHCHHVGIAPPAGNAKVAKAALGAEARLATSYHKDGAALATQLVATGVVLWALESNAAAESVFAIRDVPARLALVVGNEISGVDPGILAHCQRSLALPMVGEKNSLNVGHAFAAAAYCLAYRVGQS